MELPLGKVDKLWRWMLVMVAQECESTECH